MEDNYFLFYFSESKLKQLLLLLLILFANPNLQAQEKSIILGRPTNTSITSSILFDQNIQYYLEYGMQSGTYTNTTMVYNNALNVPDEIGFPFTIIHPSYR